MLNAIQVQKYKQNNILNTNSVGYLYLFASFKIIVIPIIVATTIKAEYHSNLKEPISSKYLFINQSPLLFYQIFIN